MYRFLTALAVTLFLSMQFAYADENRDVDRKALLKILSDIEQGVNDNNLDLMLQHMDEHVVVTWLNAEVSNGLNEVRNYFEKMVGEDAKDTVLKKYETHPKVTQPAIFYGDFAVAVGETKDIFTPHDRSKFHFISRWSATLHKVEGEWKIISLTLSTNAFDNVLIDEFKSMLRYIIMGALFGIILLEVLLYLLFRRKQE